MKHATNPLDMFFMRSWFETSFLMELFDTI